MATPKFAPRRPPPWLLSAQAQRPPSRRFARWSTTRSGQSARPPVDALACLGHDGVTALIELLTDPDASIRAGAAAQFAEHREINDGRAVTALIELLKDDDPFVSSSAPGGLRKGTPGAERALPALLASVQGKYRWTSPEAVNALGSFGPAAKEGVPALIDRTTSKDENVDAAAILALGEIGPDAKAAIPAVIKRLGGPNGEPRVAAVEALVRIDPRGETVLPTLMKLLTDGDRKIRGHAAGRAQAPSAHEGRAAGVGGGDGDGYIGGLHEAVEAAVANFQGVNEANVPVLASSLLDGHNAAMSLLVKVGPADIHPS